jgi:predicted branched-subunit amino acid permease
MTTIEQTTTTAAAAGPPLVLPRRDAIDGARAMLPWLVGIAPFGMVVGMTARANDLPPLLGVMTGGTIYSGSAQITAMELIGNGAAITVVVLSVLTINARLVLYGSAIAPHWRGTDARFRAAAAYLLVDPSYAIGAQRYEDGPTGGHAYYLGGALTLWVAWQVAIIIGTFAGDVVPTELGLEHVVPLFLVAELTRVMRNRPMSVAAGAGAAVAVTGTGLPMHSGLLVAIVLGGVAGLLAERRAS